MPFPLFFSLRCRGIGINGNGMKEPSCGNDRSLNRPSDLRLIFPGLSSFAVLCFQFSQRSVLEFVFFFFFLLLDDCVYILSTFYPFL